MLQLAGAGKRYGHKLLFQGIDWLITSKDRVGLVGANGTGKSTVLKILAGTVQPDTGSIWVVSHSGAPVKGDKVGLKGKVDEAFKFGGTALGTVIEERGRKVQ